MEPAEDREEVAVARGRVGDARVAEQQGEDRPERGPEDHAAVKTVATSLP